MVLVFYGTNVLGSIFIAYNRPNLIYHTISYRIVDSHLACSNLIGGITGAFARVIQQVMRTYLYLLNECRYVI